MNMNIKKNPYPRYTKEWFGWFGKRGGKIGGTRVKELYGLSFFSKIRKGESVENLKFRPKKPIKSST